MSVVRPSLDPFYAPVGSAPHPGAIHRSRPVDIATGIHATARQVVYGSTGTRNQPIAVSGTVIVPSAPWQGPGSRPILSYGVGVHGLGRDAAPSYLMRLGTEAEIPLIAMALDRGWAVAVSDGEGLGMPGPHTYGAGLSGGHAMLDVLRASIHCGLGLEDDARVLIWGYSEGGRCAAWAAELQPSYAPDLDLLGVAAGGVPSDLRAVAKAIDGGPFSGLGLAVLVGLAHAHADPSLEQILTQSGKEAAAHAATLDVVGLVVEHPEPMRHHTVRDHPWDDPVWRQVLNRERTGQRRPTSPIYLYHVHGDELVPSSVGRYLHKIYRELGADVTWDDVRADDHLAGAFVGASEAIDWLAARLDRGTATATRVVGRNHPQTTQGS